MLQVGAHLVPDADKEAMDALVAAADQELRKHNGPLGVHSRVCDPVLLGQRRGCVDYELIRRPVILRCCLHLHSIVACSRKGCKC